MKRFLIAGNWKMNLNRAEAVQWGQQVSSAIAEDHPVDVIACPPSVYLHATGDALRGSPVSLAAQDMYHEPNGAYTGEISAAMLVDLGCRYVVLGHSERRHILGESNGLVQQKVQAAIAAELIPIVCVGETLEQRQAGQTTDIVQEQVAGSLGDLSPQQVSQLVIAYEPVWAIGTGQVATPEQAEEVHADLRTILENRYNHEAATQVRIQYGGSVKPENAAELLAQPNVDGALVGGASLKADSFLVIVEAAATCLNS